MKQKIFKYASLISLVFAGILMGFPVYGSGGSGTASITIDDSFTTGTLQLTVVGNDTSNTGYSGSTSVTITAHPTASFSVTPPSINAGDSVVYNWSSAHGTAWVTTLAATPGTCPGIGVWGSGGNTNIGSTPGTSITSQAGCVYTFTYTVTGPGGTATSNATLTIGAPCGALNQACCGGTTCNSTLACSAGTCISGVGQCGSSATTYASGASSFTGSFCGLTGSNPTPSSPSFPTQGNSTNWTCSGLNSAGSSGTCTATHLASATVNGACNVLTNGQNFYTAPTTNLCSQGSASASGVWNWNCLGSGNGHTDASCSANQKQDGGCGAWSTTYAFGASSYGAGGYCNPGSQTASPTFPTAGNSASWICNGVNGGNSSGTCTATHQASGAQDGVCGTSATTYASGASAFTGSFCSVGTAGSFNPNSSFPAQGSSVTWSCSGVSGGNPSPACTATHTSGGSGCTTYTYNSVTSGFSLSASGPSTGPFSVNPGVGFYAFVDYGHTGNDATIPPTAGGSNTCTFVDFLGTVARFTCAGISAPGSYTYTTGTNANTSSNACVGATSMGTVTVNAGSSSMTDSDKQIISVNGANTSSFGANQCNSFVPLPADYVLNTGDNLTFRLDLCNDTGSASSTVTRIADTMLNLTKPTVGNGYQARYLYNGIYYALTPVEVISGNVTTLTFTLPSGHNIIAPGAIGSIIYNAQLMPPSDPNAVSSRFQNSFLMDFNSTTNYSATNATIPLLPYYYGVSVPTIKEVR